MSYKLDVILEEILEVSPDLCASLVLTFLDATPINRRGGTWLMAKDHIEHAIFLLKENPKPMEDIAFRVRTAAYHAALAYAEAYSGGMGMGGMSLSMERQKQLMQARDVLKSIKKDKQYDA